MMHCRMMQNIFITGGVEVTSIYLDRAVIAVVQLTNKERYMKLTNKLIGTLLLTLGLHGCASAPKLSQEQIQQQYQSIAQLEQAMLTAQSNNVNLLAPQGYTTADQLLSDAYSSAKKGLTLEAEKYAKQGSDAISQARRDATKSSDILNDVLDARAKTLNAGVQDLYPKDLDALDKDLAKTTALIERGRMEDAKKARPELFKAYSDLELKSVKESTVQRAKAAIAHARSNDANKLAPKTFKSAEESLAAAIAVLDADRTARNRAEAAAQHALIEAVRSENISEVVRDYDRRDFSPEEIVLWYQDQLAEVANPLKQLRFNEPNKQTVSNLKQDIVSLVQDRQRLAEASAAQAKAEAALAQSQLQSEQQIARLKMEFAGEKTVLTKVQKERDARFKRIQQMFNKDEAIVYRQNNNVLISVQGFRFPPGSSEIQPQNFSTMNKIVNAIKIFKYVNVKVSGHTDITGTNESNLSLSEQRAENVAHFLTEVGHIPVGKVTAEGFGSEKPVATNATAQGRAQNRRIEVLIVNE